MNVRDGGTLLGCICRRLRLGICLHLRRNSAEVLSELRNFLRACGSIGVGTLLGSVCAKAQKCMDVGEAARATGDGSWLHGCICKQLEPWGVCV